MFIKKIIIYFINWFLFLIPLFLIFYFINIFIKAFIKYDWSLYNIIIYLFVSFSLIALFWYLISRGFKYYIFNKRLSYLNKFPIILNLFLFFKKIFLVFNFWKSIFNQPVYYNNWSDIRLWFITNSNLWFLWFKNYSSVYFPNPFSFFWEMLIIETHKLSKIENSDWELITFIISWWLLTKDLVSKLSNKN